MQRFNSFSFPFCQSARSVPSGRRTTLSACAVALALAVGVVSTAAATPGQPQASIQLPYQVDLEHDDGTALDGTYGVTARLYADSTTGSNILWEESFSSVVVDDGRLSLILGTGTPVQGQLDATTFVDHPNASVQLEIDGQAVGDPTLVGMVPRALHAQTVPASGIRYGGADGLVPVEAVERTVEVFSGIYSSGDTIPTVAGWACEHHVSSINALPGISGDTVTLHVHDTWIGRVGPGSIPFQDFSTFSVPSNTPSDELRLLHAWTDCNTATSNKCAWSSAEDPAVTATVFTVCHAP